MRKRGQEPNSWILVLIAALNEQDGIGPTLAEIQENLDRPYCLVVDGRSTDATVNIAEARGAEVILQEGSGKGDAIAIGLAHSRNLDVKYAVFIDADCTYPAGYLPRMISMLESNPKVGMICGDRFTEYLRSEAMLDIFYLGNRFLALIHNLLSGMNLRDPLTGLRVVRWKILRYWKPKSKGFDVEVELNLHVQRQGYAVMEIPIFYRKRLGKKKLKLRHGIAILRRIATEIAKTSTS
jgi:dolichol-phosphate mannosyltransferase